MWDGREGLPSVTCPVLGGRAGDELGLDLAEYAINDSINLSTGYNPFFLAYSQWVGMILRMIGVGWFLAGRSHTVIVDLISADGEPAAR